MRDLYDPECERLARHFLTPRAKGGSVNSTAKRLAGHIQEAIDDWIGTQSRCKCGDLILPGQLLLGSGDGGFLHAECCDPEPESYVDENDEPLKEGDPIPEGFIWTEEDAKP